MSDLRYQADEELVRRLRHETKYQEKLREEIKRLEHMLRRMIAHLKCPRCDDGYLHQGKVTIYQPEEDSLNVRKTTVDGSDVESRLVASDGSGNPSQRRHGLTIAFECEVCGGDLELTIAQHKGITF